MPRWLVRLYGIPHEGLHALALLLIGRRPARVGRDFIDIPDDLSDAQFIFVTAAPTVVFIALWVAGIVLMFNAGGFAAIAGGLALSIFAGMGAAGGMGDMQIIYFRLQARRAKQDSDRRDA